MEYPLGFVPAYRKKPICGVLAVAVCAGVSYDVAHAATRAATFKADPSRKRFGGRTYLRDLKTAMEGMAVKLSKTYKYELTIPVSQFAENVAMPDVTYLLQISGHFVTLRNNILIDQQESAPVGEHWTSKRQVQKFVAVLGKGW